MRFKKKLTAVNAVLYVGITYDTLYLLKIYAFRVLNSMLVVICLTDLYIRQRLLF